MPRWTKEKTWEGKIDVKGPNDCWEFQGCRNKLGYGVKYKGLVHRAVYERDVGPIPKDMCVCHSCDNPACCNPKHLWLGTQKDNYNDMLRKGRQAGPQGSQHPQSKLTVEQVKQIRTLYPGKSQQKIADMYGVTQPAIGFIVRNVTYKGLEYYP